jgi:hypothetical protein
MSDADSRPEGLAHSPRFVTAAVYSESIDTLYLRLAVVNALRAEGIYSIGELVERNESELLRMANFGKKSLQELRDALDRRGLKLGTKLAPETQEGEPAEISTLEARRRLLAERLGFFTEGEVAELTGYALATLETYRRRGTGFSWTRAGTKVLYPCDALRMHLMSTIRLAPE